jgi:hypothetical protein
MFSPEYIQQINLKAARDAAKQRQEPYVPFDAEETDSLRCLPFPFLAGHIPKGWTQVDQFFCDISGLGSEAEPAMTIPYLKNRMKENLDKPGTYGYSIIECGQFQAWIGVYLKTE